MYIFAHLCTFVCGKLFQVILAHNEDVPPELANSGILLSAEIYPDELNGFSHEHFTAYAYSGKSLLLFLAVLTSVIRGYSFTDRSSVCLDECCVSNAI